MADYDTVLKNWDGVAANYAAHGNLLLTRLFKKHRHTQKLFPKFVDIAEADMESSTAMSNLGATVLQTFHKMLKTKGNHTEIVKALATSHGEKYKVPFNDFKLLIESIRDVVAEKAALDAAGQQALDNVIAKFSADAKANFK